MTEINQNPLLAKIKLPGRFFQLPSKGALYNNGELDPTIQNGEIHVHAMSAMDEIVMKNPDMLFSGKAINQIFKTCIPAILKPDQLFGKDIDALMIYLRAVTYGPEYEISARHDCDGAKQHSYIINLDEVIESMQYLDPTTIAEQYNVALPNGQVMVLQPVRYHHIIELLQANENKKEFSAKDVQNNLIMNLLNITQSVDGITDRKLIEEWLRGIPPTWVGTITDAIDKINDWGPVLERKVKCKDCGEEMDVDIPINPISFFSA